ncbi:hypothetical protein [Streptosporangium sp. NPDC051022]|uniref:hypothetical protein n=1 Tax=Streptosporangium sp. NPDC051022 TaxID=3155752 RepID=UPI003417800F
MSDIAERFRRETADHVMEIKHDDDLYRHLRFMEPKHSSYWFDLITVPGALIFRGDGESFVFSRLPDMFEFFRGPVGRINPHYWAEKLTSDRDSVMKYNQGLFEQLVKEHVAEAIINRSAPRGISRAIKELFETGDITWEGGARRALEEFEYRTFKASCKCGDAETFTDDLDATMRESRHVREHIRDVSVTHRTSVERTGSFSFSDVWEWNFRDYDWWFLWALHGIVWGIAQYDAAKAAEAQTSPAQGGGSDA